MQLIGMLDSPFVRRTAISARFLGLELEHKALSVFRNYDELRAINPLVKAPTLITDKGSVLVDSTLIIDYLEQVAGRSLMPDDPDERECALRVIGIALTAMEKTAHIHYELQQRPAEFRWPAWRDRLVQQLSGAFTELEQGVDAGWICGSDVSQADITVAVAWAFGQLMSSDLIPADGYPRVAAHAARAEALPEFLAVPIDD